MSDTRSPYTGHLGTCPTYDTLDAADCTCPPEAGPMAAWEVEALASATVRAHCRRCGAWVTGTPVPDPGALTGVNGRRALMVTEPHSCATRSGLVVTDEWIA